MLTLGSFTITTNGTNVGNARTSTSVQIATALSGIGTSNQASSNATFESHYYCSDGNQLWGRSFPSFSHNVPGATMLFCFVLQCANPLGTSELSRFAPVRGRHHGLASTTTTIGEARIGMSHNGRNIRKWSSPSLS